MGYQKVFHNLLMTISDVKGSTSLIDKLFLAFWEVEGGKGRGARRAGTQTQIWWRPEGWAARRVGARKVRAQRVGARRMGSEGGGPKGPKRETRRVEARTVGARRVGRSGRGFTRRPKNSKFVRFAWFTKIKKPRPPTEVHAKPGKI